MPDNPAIHDRLLTPTDIPTRLFRASWGLYESIIHANYMGHREIHAAVREVIRALARRQPYSILDLGCGSVRGVAEILQALPPARYLGVDLSQPALVEAAKNLSGLPKVELREEDMLSTLDDLTQRGQQFDLVYSGFAMHHLPAAAKARMFESVSRLLTPDGVFLLIDITREPGEARAEYLVNYLHMVRTEWDTLEETQIADVCDHVTAHDFPEPWLDLEAMASAAGFVTRRVLTRQRQHWAMEFSLVNSKVAMQSC